MQSLHYGQSSGMVPPNFQPQNGGMMFPTEFSGQQPTSYNGASHQRGPSNNGMGQNTGQTGEQFLSYNADLQQQRAVKNMTKVVRIPSA